MSLGVIIKSPEGLVLAAESRVTLSSKTVDGQVLHNYFDNATKVFTISEPYDDFGVVTYGQSAIQFRTLQSFIPEFEATLQKENPYDESKPETKLSVSAFAKKLSDFIAKQWALSVPAPYTGPNMIVNVSGFDRNEPYGSVYSFEIPGAPNPVEQSPKLNNLPQFGITWGGQREIADRIILGYDLRLFQILTQSGLDAAKINEIRAKMGVLNLQLPIQFMPLQDCINLAVLLITATIEAQTLTIGINGCGGAIDVAIITRNKKVEFVNKKYYHFEKIL
jgi:20S proteasome alpha/beta subunit